MRGSGVRGCCACMRLMQCGGGVAVAVAVAYHGSRGRGRGRASARACGSTRTPGGWSTACDTDDAADAAALQTYTLISRGEMTIANNSAKVKTTPKQILKTLQVELFSATAHSF